MAEATARELGRISFEEALALTALLAELGTERPLAKRLPSYYPLVAMFQKLRGAWAKWRESRRQYPIDRALYKAGGGRGVPSLGGLDDVREGGPSSA